MTGDGLCAAFDDPKDAVAAALQFQQALADPGAIDGVALRARCGLHAGAVERRDNDFFGSVLNRAARIMAAAHGGQVLVSHALAVLLVDRPPAGVTFRDLGSVRLRDLASPERVFQVLHPALRQEFPALRSLSSTPNNLPQQVTSFIGRERELSEIRRRAQEGAVGDAARCRRARQDAVVPAGGCRRHGRLSRRRLAGRAGAVRRCPNGSAGHRVRSRESRKRLDTPCLEALAKAVKDRRLLLILDNCEHLLQACAETSSQLLQAGPQMKILATSREPLHVAGETTYPLPALAVPDPQQKIPPCRIERFPGDIPFRGSRVRRATQLSPDRAERGLRSRHLPSPRRHTARDRACRGPRARAVRPKHRGAPVGSLPAADGRRSDGAAAPADVARADRLELRPPHPHESGSCFAVWLYSRRRSLKRADVSAPGDGVAESEVLSCSPISSTNRLVMMDADGGRYGSSKRPPPIRDEQWTTADGDATRPRPTLPIF